MPNIFAGLPRRGKRKERRSKRRDKRQVRRSGRAGRRGERAQAYAEMTPQEHAQNLMKSSQHTFSRGGVVKSGVTSYKDIHDMENGG